MFIHRARKPRRENYSVLICLANRTSGHGAVAEAIYPRGRTQDLSFISYGTTLGATDAGLPRGLRKTLMMIEFATGFAGFP
jgi:hypothetical protein